MDACDYQQFINGSPILTANPRQVSWISKQNDRMGSLIDDHIEKSTYTTAFKRLAMAGLITALLPEHSRSSTDRLLIAQEKEAQKYTITTAKDMKAIKLAAQAQIDAEFSMTEGIGMVSVRMDHMLVGN